MKFRTFEPRGARRAALLCTSALAGTLVFAVAVQSARADGGTGGSQGNEVGGAGGAGFTGNPGANSPTGGGGGGGAGGGAGGSGSINGAGGAGGTMASPNGQDGVTASGGGGGGGGGFNGNGAGAATISVMSGSALMGGKGGAGGSGGGFLVGGGGGGAGGYGAIVTGGGSSSNMGGMITGGTGGAGGGSGDGGFGTGGKGGDGGVGVRFTASGATLTNTGTIAGGTGGAAGALSVGGMGTAGTAGAGGAGIFGAENGGLVVNNSGTITGGLSGDGMTRANAITFTTGMQNTLQLQSGSNIVGNVVAAAGNNDMLQLGGASNASMDVSKIGATAQYQNFASFEKTGTSTWTLTNTTAAVTPWTINQGTLAVSADGAFGAVSGGLSINGGTLQYASGFSTSRNIALGPAGAGSANMIDTNGNSATLGGVLSGTNGGFTKIGNGTLTLSGTNTYTGATAINAGALAVNGSTASSSMTTVGSGAMLTGTGTVGATSVMSGGTFAPGSGTAGSMMNVTGSLTLASGATYMVQISPTASSMASVTGTATLGGSTVQAVFGSGTFMTNTYTILQAGTVSGSFATTVSNTNLPAGFTETVTTSGNKVTLNLTAALGGGGGGGGGNGNGGGSGGSGGGSVSGNGLNANQQNVANALNNFFNSGGALPPAFVNVFGLTGTNLTNALSQLSGESATGAQQGAVALMTEFFNLVLDPFVYGGGTVGSSGALGFAPERATLPDDVALAYAKVLGPAYTKAPAAFEQRWNVWASGFGGQNTTRGDVTTGSHDVTASAGGAAAGADYHLTRDSVVGFTLAGAGTNWSVAQGLGGGRSDAFQAGIYGATRSGPAYLAGTLAFANNWVSTSRVALSDQLTASFNAQSFGGRVEGGYRFAVPFGGVSPYAALQATNFRTPAYSETDVTGGGFGLSFNARTATDTRGELGARFDHVASVMPDSVVTFRGRLAWAHDWDSNPSLAAAFQALPGSSFIVNGATPASDLALVTAGAELAFRNGVALSGKFDGEFANRSQTYAGTATLRYRW